MATGIIYGAWVRTYFRLRIEWTNTPNSADNTSSLNVKLYWENNGPTAVNNTTLQAVSLTIGGVAHTGSISPGVGAYSSKKLLEITKTVNHGVDGALTLAMSGYFEPKMTLNGGYVSSVSCSGNAVLEPTNRESIPTNFNTFVIGSGVTFTAPRASTSFTNTFKLMSGETVIATKTGQGDTSTFTAGDLDGIYALIPDALSAPVTLTVTTFLGASQIGSPQSRNGTASVGMDIIPTAGTILATENNSAVSALGLGTNQFASGISELYLRLTGHAGIKGSTIEEVVIELNRVYYGQESYSDPVRVIGTIPIKAKVKDSRGLWSNEITLDVTFHAYQAPKITTFRAVRDTVQTTAKLTINASVSSLNGKNRLSYTIRSAPMGGSFTDLASGMEPVGDFNLVSTPTFTSYNVLNSYTFQLEIEDAVGTVVIYNAILPTLNVPMSWSKTGVGINKIWEAGALDVGGDIEMSGRITGRLKSIQIPASANLNDYRKSGVYYCASADTASIVNLPSTFNTSNSFVMECVNNERPDYAGIAQDQCIQRLTDISTGTEYFRRGGPTTFGAWVTVRGSSGQAMNAYRLEGHAWTEFELLSTLVKTANGTYFLSGKGLVIMFHVLTLSYIDSRTYGATWTFPMEISSTTAQTAVVTGSKVHSVSAGTEMNAGAFVADLVAGSTGKYGSADCKLKTEGTTISGYSPKVFVIAIGGVFV